MITKKNSHTPVVVSPISSPLVRLPDADDSMETLMVNHFVSVDDVVVSPVGAHHGSIDANVHFQELPSHVVTSVLDDQSGGGGINDKDTQVPDPTVCNGEDQINDPHEV